MGYSLWGLRDQDTTEATAHTHAKGWVEAWKECDPKVLLHFKVKMSYRTIYVKSHFRYERYIYTHFGPYIIFIIHQQYIWGKF